MGRSSTLELLDEPWVADPSVHGLDRANDSEAGLTKRLLERVIPLRLL